MHLSSSALGRRTLVDIFSDAAQTYSEKTAVVTQEGRRISYAELQRQALHVEGALRSRGVENGDRVALFFENVPEFLPSNIGTLYAGATSVLMRLRTNPKEAIGRRLDFVEPKIILTLEEDKKKVAEHNKKGIPVLSFEKALDGKIMGAPVNVNPDDHAVYIFSSGTTGEDDKVIMLTHENIASNIIAVDSAITPIKNGRYMTGIADNTHSFEHLLQLWTLHQGMQLHYTDVSKFMKAASKIRPHYMIMIPKNAEAIMDHIRDDFEKRGLLPLLEKAVHQSTLYYRAVLRGKQPDAKAKFIHHLADFTIYYLARRGLRKKFGRDVRKIIGGSAILLPQVQEFFLAIGRKNFWVEQGYGLTETAPAISVNTTENFRINPGSYGVGSSGRVLPGIEVMIADPDELEDSRRIVPLEDGREGMLLVKGPNVFPGYFKNPEETKKVFVGGWFITGDSAIRESVNDFSRFGPHLYVTGRYKDLIVLNNGQKLAPELMERRYGREAGDLISRLVCVGNKRDYLAAIAIPQEEIKLKILRREIDEEEVIRQIQERLKSSRRDFGFVVRRVTLDLNFEPAKYETSLRKFRKRTYLNDKAELVESLYS